MFHLQLTSEGDTIVRKTILIGIDGVPFHQLQTFTNNGTMPHLKELLNDGTFIKMKSSIPPVSSASWSNIITGVNPGTHNIYGFTEIIQGTYTLQYPNFTSLKHDPFWLNNNQQNIIINVPMTYPPSPINGRMVSGFVSLDFNKAVYPQSFLNYLTQFKYEIDVDSSLIYKSVSLFFRKLFDVHEKRIKVFNALWKQQWDTFMFVFTGSDRLGHFFYPSANDTSSTWHANYLKYYHMLDTVFEQISQTISDDDTLMIMSDHGMAQINHQVNANVYLEQQGLLKMQSGVSNYNGINGGKIFCLPPGRFYVNHKDKYPKGEQLDTPSVVNETIATLKDLRYKGRSVIEHIFRKEDVYSGDYIKNAPDIVAIPFPGFSLNSGIGKTELFEPPSRINGMHTYDDAFFYLRGDHKLPKDMRTEDIVPVLGEIDAHK